MELLFLRVMLSTSYLQRVHCDKSGENTAPWPLDNIQGLRQLPFSRGTIKLWPKPVDSRYAAWKFRFQLSAWMPDALRPQQWHPDHNCHGPRNPAQAAAENTPNTHMKPHFRLSFCFPPNVLQLCRGNYLCSDVQTWNGWKKEKSYKNNTIKGASLHVPFKKCDANGETLWRFCAQITLGNSTPRSEAKPVASYSPWGCKRAGHDLATEQHYTQCPPCITLAGL